MQSEWIMVYLYCFYNLMDAGGQKRILFQLSAVPQGYIDACYGQKRRKGQGRHRQGSGGRIQGQQDRRHRTQEGFGRDDACRAQ